MATATGYMIVREDFTTTNLPLDLEVVAEPSTSVDALYSAGDGVSPGLGGTAGHALSPWAATRRLSAAANCALNRRLRGQPGNRTHSLYTIGQKVIEVEYDEDTDVAGLLPPPGVNTTIFLKHVDVIDEVDLATLQAAATLPSRYWAPQP